MSRTWIIVLSILILGDIIVGFRWLSPKGDKVFDNAIRAAARRHQIDPALVKAVVWQESRFNPTAKGKAGELGLMQIRELAAAEWAEAENIKNFEHHQLLDPVLNTQAGSWYLAKLLKRYPQADDPLPYALADYNAGRTHVLRWNYGNAATNSSAFLKQISFPGTRDYIEKVVRRYRRYLDSDPRKRHDGSNT